MSADLNLPGPRILSHNEVQFRLWAPACESIQLELVSQSKLLQMVACDQGWHERTCNAAAGEKYRFILPDGKRVPDPASRFQPEDVHGPSEIVDAASWQWKDSDWNGQPWNKAIIYELH